MAEEDEELCPICAEPLDETERRFKPCRCGYQMCGFCWHHIKDELNGPCPQCRTPYSPENYAYLPPAPAAKKGAKKQHSGRAAAAAAAATSATAATAVPAVGAAELEARKRLADIRVVQRNLVYVTNIPLGFLGCGPNTPLAAAAADSAVQVLRHAEYFGQYGRIVKLVVNTGTVYNANSPQGPTVSCYVTYRRNEEAAACVRAVNGAWLDGKLLRASFGTTKYCAHFLRGSVCTNPDCLYLHELGHDRDSFTKEAMAVGKNLFSSHVQPRIAFALADGKNVLPPAAAVPAKPSPFIPPPIAYERALQLLPPESPADVVRQQPLQPKPGAKTAERREDDGAFSLLVAGVLTHFLSHIARPPSSRASASASAIPAVSQPSPPVVVPAAVSAAAAARERLSRSEDVGIVGTTRGRSVSPVGSSMQSSSPPAAGSYLAAVRAFHPSQTTSPSASPPLPQREVSLDSSPKSSQSSSADTSPTAPATTTTTADQQQSRKKKKKQEEAESTPEATESSTRTKADPPGSYPMPQQQQQQQQQQAPLPLPAMPLLPPVLWFAESFKMMQHQPQDPAPEPPSLPAEPTTPAEVPEDVAEIAPLDFVESLLNESQSSQPSSPPAQTVPAAPATAPVSALDPAELRRQCFRELFPSVHISFSDEPDQVQPQQAFPGWQPLHHSSGPQPYNPFLPAAFQVASFASTAPPPPPQPGIPAFAAPPPQPDLPPKHRAHTHHAPAPEPGQPPEKLAQTSTPAVSASISAPTASQGASPATAKPGPASPPAKLMQTAAPAPAPKQTQASAHTSKAPVVASAISPPPAFVEQPRPVRQKPKLKIQTKEQQQQQRLEPLVEPPPVSPMTPLPPPVLPVPQLQQKPSPEHTSPQLPTPVRRAKKPAEEESHMKATAASQESTAPQERKLSKRQLRMQRRQQAQAASTSEAASTSPAISAVAKEESPRAVEPVEARSAVQPQQQTTSSKKQKSRAKSPQQPQATGTAAAAAVAPAAAAATTPASDPRESGETEDLIVGACPGCGGLILRDDLFASLSLSSATMDIAALEQIATDVSTIAEALPDSLHGISELMRVHKAAAACDHGEYTHIPIMLPILPVPLCPLRFSRVTADLLDDSHTITELLSAIDPLGGHQQQQQQSARAPTTQEEVQRLEAEWASTCHDFEELDARLRDLQLRTSTTSSAPPTSKFDIPH